MEWRLSLKSIWNQEIRGEIDKNIDEARDKKKSEGRVKRRNCLRDEIINARKR